LTWYEAVNADGRRGFVYVPLVEGQVDPPRELGAALDFGVSWSFIDNMVREADAGDPEAQWRLGLW
jgi:hypothetical protein